MNLKHAALFEGELIFIGLNHSPEMNGTCRNCGGVYGHERKPLP